MFQVAIYGKGGIGKSTMSANISYSMSSMGKKVTQIGCDPKHDSTRLLLNGKNQNTVLEYLRRTPKEHRELNAVVSNGSGGVRCIEAGGPEPGVGCAGRGILTMFDFLDSNGLDEEDYDFKLYDVLGDVVCGGFAVPLRKGYADAVYIVTSGEFMSLYAANNILKGLLNYDTGKPRVGGIILNHRGMEGEYEYVKNFADGVGLPIISCIPRDPLFADAESKGKTLAELYPQSKPFTSIRSIAEDIIRKSENPSTLHHSHPLSDEEMDLVAKGTPLQKKEGLSYCRVHNPVADNRSLKSCAGNGAVAHISRIRGTHTIIHGPTSCAYMMCCHSDMMTLRRNLHGDLAHIWSNVSCTCLDDSASVFGGMEILEDMIRKRADKGDKAIFVISMCVPGIIGDNITDLCSNLSKELNIKVIAVPVDGIGVGGVSQGRDVATERLLGFMEPVEAKDGTLINVMGDHRSGREFSSHFDRSFEDLLRLAGFKINSMYPGKCTMDDVRIFGRAALAMRTVDSISFNRTCEMICKESGVTHMREPMPHSMIAIERWMDEVMELTGRDLTHAKESVRREYEEGLVPIKKRTSGRKVVVVTNPAVKRDWLMELLNDLGIEVVKSRDATFNRWVLGSDSHLDKEEYVTEMVRSDIAEFKPDAVLSDEQSDIHLEHRHCVIGEPHAGLEGILDYAERLGMLMDTPVVEGWRL